MGYAIKVTPNYYAGTLGAPQEGFLTWRDMADNPNDPSATDDIAEWDTEAEAQAVIDDAEDGTYYLSHGEAGRPTYEIIDLDEGDGEPDCYPGSYFESGDWEEVDPVDLPDGVWEELDNLNVEYWRQSDDYDIYSGVVERDDIKYMIVFCPRTVALQLAGDDLGNVDWENQAYYREVD